MAHKPKTIDATVAQMQQILDREYPHLEWRVLAGPASGQTAEGEIWVFVHVRTRDFRFYKVTMNYWLGLFHCYAEPAIPRTNN